LGAILGFLKRLYEHKEKIILGLVVIASIGFGYVQWKEWKGGDEGDGPEKNGETGGIPVPDDTPLPPPPSYAVPNLGNRVSLENQWTLADNGIFEKPEPKEGPDATDQPAAWPTIVIRSIFDATKSGTFIAIIEINGKREFKKEGEFFLDSYEVRRIDGVRNCLTIVKRGSITGEEEKEFCKDN
jgi:hypothetical protein